MRGLKSWVGVGVLGFFLGGFVAFFGMDFAAQVPVTKHRQLRRFIFWEIVAWPGSKPMAEPAPAQLDVDRHQVRFTVLPCRFCVFAFVSFSQIRTGVRTSDRCGFVA